MDVNEGTCRNLECPRLHKSPASRAERGWRDLFFFRPSCKGILGDELGGGHFPMDR